MITLNIYAQLSWTLQTKLALPLKKYIYHSSNASHDVSKIEYIYRHHMENEILEIIDTIETIELSDGKAKETGDLEDTFFWKLCNQKRCLEMLQISQYLLSERISMSSTQHFNRSFIPRNKVDNGDNCNCYPKWQSW